MKTWQLLILSGACLLTIVLRATPMVLPGTPTGLDCMLALALICGSGLRKWWAPLLPLAVRLLTDTIIHLKTGNGFWPSMAFDYSAYAGIAILARWIPAKRLSVVVAGGLLTPLLFFAVSNFGVWWLWPETYSTTLTGLAQCYAAGIPYLRISLVSNFAFCLLFFSLWNTVTAIQTSSSAGPAFPGQIGK